MFFHYSEFPLSMRTLFTGTLLVLGLAYLFAMVHLYNSHSGRDGSPGMSVDDIAIAYSGSDDATKLEAALLGPMSGMLPTDERGDIVGWVRRGLDEKEYDNRIKPIFDKRCLSCHDGSNPHIPNVDGYEEVAKLAEVDTGMDVFTLIRVSHIHLFGITFIFFIMGLIFSHAFVRPVWFKSLVVALPFLAIIIDVLSWYVTKVFPPFAYAVILGGGLMGLSFAFQWVVSMYQIWFSKYSVEKPVGEATTV
ncbi:MAG: hypothetical protein OEU09_03105 [Rhodospirillales bacterium]|nr:hypothetical protein [Rhodospirillales bacterium]MDH3916686.1 hypothetical protein [Rhodospirillales bacterium]MDH3966288.1 hypothetical protein [Rhodospirillales bacterium]